MSRWPWVAMVLVPTVLMSGCHPRYRYDSLRRVRPDMTRADVQQVMRGTARHQFTTTREGDEVACGSYYLEGGDKVYLVFQNDRLTKMIDRAWIWDAPPTPELRVLSVLDSQEIVDIDDLEARYRERRRGQTLPVVLVATETILYEIRPQKNRALVERYDGFRVELGMTPSEVALMLGPPHRQRDVANQTYATYGGDPEHLSRVSWPHRFPRVMVVYRDGAAEHVYSDDFFDYSLAAEPYVRGENRIEVLPENPPWTSVMP
ncbi:MAG: hypothetical protein GY715_13115 [Planctomycetes bacterium]|nr:hypothetical protein [Planctomycetota bacterium]